MGLWLNRDRQAARQAAIIARGFQAAQGHGLDDGWFDAVSDTEEEAKAAKQRHRAAQREAELQQRYKMKP